MAVPTQDQKLRLAKLRELATQEVAAEQEAQVAADRVYQEMLAPFREATNRAIVEAVNEEGVRVTWVAHEVFGNTDRKGVYARMEEVAHDHV